MNIPAGPNKRSPALRNFVMGSLRKSKKGAALSGGPLRRTRTNVGSVTTTQGTWGKKDPEEKNPVIIRREKARE